MIDVCADHDDDHERPNPPAALAGWRLVRGRAQVARAKTRFIRRRSRLVRRGTRVVFRASRVRQIFRQSQSSFVRFRSFQLLFRDVSAAQGRAAARSKVKSFSNSILSDVPAKDGRPTRLRIGSSQSSPLECRYPQKSPQLDKTGTSHLTMRRFAAAFGFLLLPRQFRPAYAAANGALHS